MCGVFKGPFRINCCWMNGNHVMVGCGTWNNTTNMWAIFQNLVWQNVQQVSGHLISYGIQSNHVTACISKSANCKESACNVNLHSQSVSSLTYSAFGQLDWLVQNPVKSALEASDLYKVAYEQLESHMMKVMGIYAARVTKLWLRWKAAVESAILCKMRNTWVALSQQLTSAWGMAFYVFGFNIDFTFHHWVVTSP